MGSSRAFCTCLCASAIAVLYRTISTLAGMKNLPLFGLITYNCRCMACKSQYWNSCGMEILRTRMCWLASGMSSLKFKMSCPNVSLRHHGPSSAKLTIRESTHHDRQRSTSLKGSQMFMFKVLVARKRNFPWELSPVLHSIFDIRYWRPYLQSWRRHFCSAQAPSNVLVHTTSSSC